MREQQKLTSLHSLVAQSTLNSLVGVGGVVKLDSYAQKWAYVVTIHNAASTHSKLSQGQGHLLSQASQMLVIWLNVDQILVDQHLINLKMIDYRLC